jgi:hypothetical protein
LHGERLLLAACRIDGPAGAAIMARLLLAVLINPGAAAQVRAGARAVLLGWDGCRGLRGPEPTVRWLEADQFA